jgi:hypothetical protein
VERVFAAIRQFYPFAGAEPCTIKSLPAALEDAVYVQEKWPFVIDVSGQASRYLRYQRGSTLMVLSSEDVKPESLRRSLVGGLRFGSNVTLDLSNSTKSSFRLSDLFSGTHFPEAVVKKSALYKEETWAPLLRPDQGEPEPHAFLPLDAFKLVLISRDQDALVKFADDDGKLLPHFHPIVVLEENKPAGDGTDGDDKVLFPGIPATQNLAIIHLCAICCVISIIGECN